MSTSHLNAERLSEPSTGQVSAARRGVGNRRRVRFPTDPGELRDSDHDLDAILLRPIEVARLLGLSRSKVFELLAAETLPVVRFGRAVRVPRRQLEAWVERQVGVGGPAGLDTRWPDR